MDRKDFFFRQRVTEGEMDAAFDDVQDFLKVLLTTLSPQDGVHCGTLFGANQWVTEHAPQDMTVDLHGPINAIDADGNAIHDPNILINIDCVEDLNGNPTAVQLAGNEKYITVAVAYDEDLLDPRTDGNGNTVYHVRNASRQYEVYQGVDALAGFAVPPAVPSDRVLICDILLHWNDVTIANADISKTRNSELIAMHGSMISMSGVSFTEVTPTDFWSAATGPTALSLFEDIDAYLAAHLDGTGPHHDAVDIDYDNAVSGLVATDVQAAIDEVVATGAFWDTAVRFSGLVIDPGATTVPAAGELRLLLTGGTFEIGGTPAAGAGTYSRLTFGSSDDGQMVLLQGEHAGNSNQVLSVFGYSTGYAATIRNFYPAGSSPAGLSITIDNPNASSVGLDFTQVNGRVIQATLGGAGTSAEIFLYASVGGAAALGTVTGFQLLDAGAPVTTGATFRGVDIQVNPANWVSATECAYLANTRPGAGGSKWTGVHILPGMGGVPGATGLDVDLTTNNTAAVEVSITGVGGASCRAFEADILAEGQAFYILTSHASARIGDWWILDGTGLSVNLDAGTAFDVDMATGTVYGMNLHMTAGAAITALLRLVQDDAGTGLAILGVADPAEDFCSVTALAKNGSQTKAGFKVDYSAALVAGGIPFWGKTKAQLENAFYAEQGGYDYKDSVGGYYGLDRVFRLFAVDAAVQWEEQRWVAGRSGLYTGVYCDYVLLDRDLEVPANDTQADAVTKRRIASAWVESNTGGGGINGGHFNVLTVTKIGVGIYEVTLDVNGVPTGRSVHVTPIATAGTDVWVPNVVDPEANPIVVRISKVSNGGVVGLDDCPFSLVVYQDT